MGWEVGLRGGDGGRGVVGGGRGVVGDGWWDGGGIVLLELVLQVEHSGAALFDLVEGHAGALDCGEDGVGGVVGGCGVGLSASWVEPGDDAREEGLQAAVFLGVLRGG